MTDEAFPAKSLGLSERSIAVALITIARYIADKDPGFLAYLASSLEHAQASSLLEADLAALKLLIGAIGGS